MVNRPIELVTAEMTRSVPPLKMWMFTIEYGAGAPSARVAKPVKRSGVFVGKTVGAVWTMTV